MEISQLVPKGKNFYLNVSQVDQDKGDEERYQQRMSMNSSMFALNANPGLGESAREDLTLENSKSMIDN